MKSNIYLGHVVLVWAHALLFFLLLIESPLEYICVPNELLKMMSQNAYFVIFKRSIVHCNAVSIGFKCVDAVDRRFVEHQQISLSTMERLDKRKPLTKELKGSLITLFRLGFTITQIAQELDCHVS